MLPTFFHRTQMLHVGAGGLLTDVRMAAGQGMLRSARELQPFSK